VTRSVRIRDPDGSNTPIRVSTNVVGEGPSNIMTNGAISVEWGYTSAGFQPIRISRSDSPYSYFEFEDFPFWAIQFQDGGVGSSLSSVKTGTETVTYLSDTSWLFTWVAGSVTVEVTMTISGDTLEFVPDVTSNDSSKRIRSLYFPNLKVKRRQFDRARDEVVVVPFWCGGVIYDAPSAYSNAALYDSVIGHNAAFYGSPGEFILDFVGYYSRPSPAYLLLQTTDVDGNGKEYGIGVASTDTTESTLLSLRNWLPGGATGNEPTLPYSVRLTIGSSSTGRHWYDMAVRFKTWIQSLSAVPDWYKTQPWPHEVKSKLIGMVHYVVAPEDSSDVGLDSVTADGSYAVGDRSVTVSGLSGVPTTTNCELFQPTPDPNNSEFTGISYRMIQVADLGGGSAVLWLDRGVQFAIEDGDSLMVRGISDPTKYQVVSAMAGNADDYVEYLSLASAEEAWLQVYNWMGYGQVWSYGDPRNINVPLWGLQSGMPEDTVTTFRAYEGSMDVLAYCIDFREGQETVSAAIGASDFIAVDDEDGQERYGTTIGMSGVTGLQYSESPAHSKLFVDQLEDVGAYMGAKGFYLDAFTGLGPPQRRNYATGIPEANRGDIAYQTTLRRDIVKQLKLRMKGALDDYADDAPSELVLRNGNAIGLKGNQELTLANGNTIGLADGTTLATKGSSTGGVADLVLADGSLITLADGSSLLVRSGSSLTKLVMATEYDAYGPVKTSLRARSGTLTLADGSTITLSREHKRPGNAHFTTEYPSQFYADLFQSMGTKYLDVLPFSVIPIPEIWRVIMEGRTEQWDLTNQPAVAGTRVATAGNDFTELQLDIYGGAAIHKFHSGWVTGVNTIGEMDSLATSTFAPGTPAGADYQANEAKLNATIKDLVEWDRLPRAREFRRRGYPGPPVLGFDLFMESWEGASEEILNNGTILVTVYRHTDYPGELLVFVSHRILSAASSYDIEFVIDKQAYPEVVSGTCRQKSKDNTSVLAGTTVSAGLQITATVSPGLTQLYEVM